MKIKNIKEKWGNIIHASYDEVMKVDSEYWRDIAYERDLLIFRGFGKIDEIQYYDFISMFGNPWNEQEYNYSVEYSKQINSNNYISKFSNKISKRLGSNSMIWHADIPNHGNKSFPWRCLYMINNPNPDDGLTTWLNLCLDVINPTPEELDMYSKIKIVNQSWYRENEEVCLQDYIKIHPITGKKSLRSNFFYNYKEPLPLPWIKETYINGKKVEPYDLIGPIHKKLQSREDLVYTHKWQNYDLILYDNWSFIHKRTRLNLKEDEERLFIRANISHIV